jgi:hypothetical protein
LRTFSKNPDTADGYERFIKISHRLHDVSNKFFFWRSIEGITDTFETSGAFNLSVLSDVLSLRMGRTVASLVRQQVPDEKAAQMIDHFTQYVGSSPEASPAVRLRHRSHADGRRCLVSDGWYAQPFRKPSTNSVANSVSPTRPTRTSTPF